MITETLGMVPFHVQVPLHDKNASRSFFLPQCSPCRWTTWGSVPSTSRFDRIRLELNASSFLPGSCFIESIRTLTQCHEIELNGFNGESDLVRAPWTGQSEPGSAQRQSLDTERCVTSDEVSST